MRGSTAAHAARLALLVAALCAFTACGAAAAASSLSSTKPQRIDGRGHWFKRSCAVPSGHAAACHALIVTNADGKPLASKVPPAAALGPAQLAKAYSLPTPAGSGQTIAIVDAYDDPNIESDLGAYSAYYGLPACTTANGCFRKVDQHGGTVYPSRNVSWSEEISLDVEIAHGICPGCKILLVEAATNSYANLAAAMNEAVALGARIASNSYGGSEFSGETASDGSWAHTGVVTTVSSGDGGYGATYPAVIPGVVSVGGTTLKLDASGNRVSETAWSKAGSGCSAYESRPAWQTSSPCSGRSVADVSADADPNSGAAVYDTYGQAGWLQVGGTSLAAPRSTRSPATPRTRSRRMRARARCTTSRAARTAAAAARPPARPRRATTVPRVSGRRTASPPSTPPARPRRRTSRSRSRLAQARPSRVRTPRSPSR
jgi:hypothetical protein